MTEFNWSIFLSLLEILTYSYAQIKKKKKKQISKKPITGVCSFPFPANECLLLIVGIIALIYYFHIFPDSLNPLQAMVCQSKAPAWSQQGFDIILGCAKRTHLLRAHSWILFFLGSNYTSNKCFAKSSTYGSMTD